MTDYKIHKTLNRLGLTEFEYREIVKKLSREPNELELYLFSAMWSEHCGYKHSRKYLDSLPSKGACFRGENSGGIRVGRHIVFFKTESHNHPSAVEPYQGAATGIGGILRDILAMNARPAALLNALKFGEIAGAGDISRRNKYLLNGVVEGISDYGNSTGVPTIGGEVDFNECYNSVPLVNVMAVGVCHKDKVKTSAAKKDAYIVLIGSATGRDGLFGAAFASKELEADSNNRISVQIGDPYTKKNLIEATLEILKSKNIYSCQDLGAAGLLSSTSEMAAKGNVAIDLYLDKVPLREKNMLPYEIMLSESQERMVFCTNSKGVNEIFQICRKYEINSALIGVTKPGNTYNLYYNDVLEASVPVYALTEPVLYDLNIKKPAKTKADSENLNLAGVQNNTLTPQEIKHYIFKMAASPRFASKKYVYRQYDNTVGARTLKNPHRLGVSPLYLFEEDKVIGFSMDSNERVCKINPYIGAYNLVFESAANAVSSGFEPCGITNCLNFANPENPETAYQFVQTINGFKDALLKLKIPVVSGNVSFYNEGIFPTPVIGMMSILKFKTPIYSMFAPGDNVFLIGKTDTHSDGNEGKTLNIADFNLETKLKKAIFHFKSHNIVSGAIDASKGGVLGALLIMLFNSRGHGAFSLGDSLNIGFKGIFKPDFNALFFETPGRYLISTQSPEGIEKYLIKNNIAYKNLGIADTTGVLDLGFAKINASELTEIYENSLERKALC